MSSSFTSSRSRWFNLFFLVLICIGTRVLWMMAIRHNTLSADLRDWQHAAELMRQGFNPYDHYPFVFNWPPFWMEVLWGISHLSTRFGFDFLVGVRAVLIIGDVIVLLAVCRLLAILAPGQNLQRLLLFGYCLNPQVMMLTVQHGNFDAFAVAWVLGGLINLIQFRRSGYAVDWLCAAGCLGMGASTKTFPILLWPLLVCGIEKISWRNRLLGAGLLALPAALALAPIYVLSPQNVAATVIGYRSFGASFGIPAIFTLAGWDHAFQIYAHHFTLTFLVALAILAIILRFRAISREEDFILLAAIILLSAFTLGPGYGAQYWFWVIPLFLICYAMFSPAFGKVVLWAGVVIIITNVFEYAVGPELGRFWFNWFPSAVVQNLGDKMMDSPTLQAWVRLPMTIATLVLLATGMGTFINRQFSRK